MHLNVFIAKSGFCSRRKASLLIKEGRVSVNNKIVDKPWFEIKQGDSVKVDKKTLKLEKKIYIVFNKPEGVTVTLKDRFADKKITDFIPKRFERVYPVGRLDKNSKGLVLLTNDGELCYKLTHPKFEVEKEYILWVKGKITKSALEQAKKGVREGDDLLKVKDVTTKAFGKNTTQLKAIISEGKKRHLRRLFRSLGFHVLDLKRVRIGKLMLGGLKEGVFQVVDKKDILK